jgi:hypothetical protein
MGDDFWPTGSTQSLAEQLQVGDLVFIRIPWLPFRKVAEATCTWTNHVGIVLDVRGDQATIGESRFPFSASTSLSRFIARSQDRRVAVVRLRTPLDVHQKAAVAAAARRRSGVFYDTGFDLRSRRQFCSRYAREVLLEASGTEVGDVESFSSLLARNPQTDLTFWRLWYFGQIPWLRETVTPASLLTSPQLEAVFDGVAG